MRSFVNCDNCLSHRRMLRKGRFNLSELNPEAADFDLIVAATEIVDISIRQIARKVASGGYVAVFGAAESADSIAMAPILERAKIPAITSGQSPKLAALHDPYEFLNTPTSITYDSTLANYIVKTKGTTRAFFENDFLSRQFADIFAKRQSSGFFGGWRNALARPSLKRSFGYRFAKDGNSLASVSRSAAVKVSGLRSPI